jgi:hypothetical protein
MTPKQLEFVNDRLMETVEHVRKREVTGSWWRRFVHRLKCIWDVWEFVETYETKETRNCPDCEEPMRVHAIVSLPVYDDLKPGMLPEGTIPLIAMLCDRCGGVELFNAYAIGVVGVHGHIKEAK